MGPAFQGNLTKILRARKQQQQQQQQSPTSDLSTTNHSDRVDASSPLTTMSIASDSSVMDHPLIKELNDWKLEHNR
jgi:hypothetical protein